MRYVNLTEFKANFAKYMQMVENEDIVVTRRGTPWAMIQRYSKTLSPPDRNVKPDAPHADRAVQSHGRFDGLDLEAYRSRVSPKQFKLLMEYIGAEDASPDFDPAHPFYPEDL